MRALCLRYGCTPNNPTQTCNCVTAFTVDHAIICPMGGFPTIHHNDIRDITASLLNEVCHNVATKPPLHPLTSETFLLHSANVADGAHPDFHASTFGSNTHSLTNGFFTLTHPATVPPHWQLKTRRMRLKRKENMPSTYRMLNMEYLHPLSSPMYEVWEGRQPSSTRDWQTWLHRSSKGHMPLS